MESTQTQSILTILLTYLGPALIGLIAVWLQHRKNKADLLETISKAEKAKAEAKKAEAEGISTEGDIFLKWTLEFKTRLETVETKNDEFAKIIKEQDERIDEQDKIIANQSVLLIDANARIILLEKENSDLKTLVAELQKENSILKGCEEQNARDISTLNNE